ncbi:MAG: hypothetical protein ACKVVP_20240, partial [Chloroflexota bacterium]
EPDQMEIIFGRDFKLDAADPYLFYAYEFRRYALMARLIVVVGYGFGDSHINKMLTQGLRNDPDRRLVAVQRWDGLDEGPSRTICDRLDLSDVERERVSLLPGTAQEFLAMPELASTLLARIPRGADAPF